MGQNTVEFKLTPETATSAGTRASLPSWGGKGSGTGVSSGSHGAAQPLSGIGSK